MWGRRSARARAKAWEAARANALEAAHRHPWPPTELPPPPDPAVPAVTVPAAEPAITPPLPAAAAAPRRTQYDGPSLPAAAPLYGRWVDAPAEAPDPAPVAAVVDRDADDLEHVVAAVAADGEAPVGTQVEATDAEVTTLRLVPATEPPAPTAGIGPHPETQAEFLRLLEVVTSMCDHVIEYIEADRAERRMMIDTLGQLSRTITAGARQSGIAGAPSAPRGAPSGLHEARERIVGGSMPAGSEPDIDLRAPEARPETRLKPVLTDASLPASSTEIAVEVRGRFGDRWVDGFEICEVMTTPDGPRYRLRRQRDGVVLPELFDATSIRHIETFEQLNGDQLSGPPGPWSRS